MRLVFNQRHFNRRTTKDTHAEKAKPNGDVGRQLWAGDFCFDVTPKAYLDKDTLIAVGVCFCEVYRVMAATKPFLLRSPAVFNLFTPRKELFMRIIPYSDSHGQATKVTRSSKSNSPHRPPVRAVPASPAPDFSRRMGRTVRLSEILPEVLLEIKMNWLKNQERGKKSKSWRQHPATRRQIKKLVELEIQFDPNITKGEASDLLSAAFAQGQRRMR